MPALRDLLAAAALAGVTCVSRLPFVGEFLYHWDSINFALSLRRFDVAASQPHVPGYPLYVLLGRFVHLFLPDEQQALAAISVVGSGLAVGALYLFALEMFGRAAALASALLLASSPLYWFYGEIALPHSLDAFVVVVAVWLLYRAARGESASLVPAAVWLGLAGGFRPQTQVFLLPLAAFAAVRSGWRRSLIALAVLAVVDVLWFAPLVVLSGGLERYLQITRDFYVRFNATTSIVSGGGLFGLRRNAIKLTMYTLYGWGAALPLLVAGLAWGRVSRRPRPSRADEPRLHPTVLLLWVMPTLLYYQFIHMGQQGLVFVYLPALCVLSGAALAPLHGARWWAVSAAVAANAAVFLFLPTFPFGGDRLKLLTADTLRRHDAFYGSRFGAIRATFDPRNTVVVSAGWRFPQYYLDTYSLVRYELVARWELGEGQSQLRQALDFGPRLLGARPDADGYRYAVLLEDELLSFDADAARQEWVDLPAGGRLAFLRLRRGEGLRLEPGSFRIVSYGAPTGPAQEGDS